MPDGDGSLLKPKIHTHFQNKISLNGDPVSGSRRELMLRMESGCPYQLIAYHAHQQCAEKYLKAFLVYLRQDFPWLFVFHFVGIVE